MYVITLNRPVRGRLWIKGSAAQAVVLPNGGLRVATTIIAPGMTKAFSPAAFWPYRKVMAALEKQGIITLTRKHAPGEVEPPAEEPVAPVAAVEEKVPAKAPEPEPEAEDVLPEGPAVAPAPEAPAPVEEPAPAPEPEPEPEPEAAVPLESKTLGELKDLADAHGVAYKSNIGKAKLIEKLHEAGVE
jgi:hypothetical protein